MLSLTPTSADELAQVLSQAASRSQTVCLTGNNSKRLMAGPVLPADVHLSTSGLRRVLQYEPGDLTISVEAGMPFREAQTFLASHCQMIALDPPFADQSTVGGIVASNVSGPMRRGYGTARDQVIGMTLATLEGKLIRTGGMVVKNVAGLDMSKLMIGSFGTLAAMTSINFRVYSLPLETRTFLIAVRDLDAAVRVRNLLTQSPLKPTAVDLLSPSAASRLGRKGYLLAIRAGGGRAVLDRYARDLRGSEQITGSQEANLWKQISEFTPDFLRREPAGIALRISAKLSDLGRVLELTSGPCVSRAASGVSYIYMSDWQDVLPLWSAAAERGWRPVVEFAPEHVRLNQALGPLQSSPESASTFDMMRRTKQMFDPLTLLNRSRLYGRL